MKKLFLLCFILVSFLLIGLSEVSAYVNVKGYYRKDGTYVNGYVRSNPNGVKYDNYGYKPSQGLYNDTYGTRGSEWDTPTYITDPDYYIGKSIYDSGLGSSSSYSSNCPLNSYASGSSCKCNYGYVVSGSSCISGSSYCYKAIGLMSQYNNTSKTCECMSGYKLDSSGQCVSKQSYCTNTFGYGAEYSYLKADCVCRSGYVVNTITNKCSLDSSYGTSNLSSSIVTSCPSNSYSSGGSCYCSSGYKLNKDKTICVTEVERNKQICEDSFGNNSVWADNNSDGTINCKCGSGYEWSKSGTSCSKITSCDSSHVMINGSCISLDESCQNHFGLNSIGVVGTKKLDNTNECNCKEGYSFSSDMKSCIISLNNNAANQNNSFVNLKFGSNSNEVKELQLKLVKKGLLTVTPNGNFGPATLRAVKLFQANNGLTANGVVDSEMMNLLNK